MATEDYEATDRARVRTVLDDATLATTLGTTFTWAGFFGNGEAVDDALSTPKHVDDGDGLPVAGGFFDITYPSGIEEFLCGDTRERQIQVRISIRRQPSPHATYMTDVLAAKAAIATRFKDLQTDDLTPYAAMGTFPNGNVNGWRETAFFQPAWST